MTYIIQEFESITAMTQASQCPGSCDCFDATEKRLTGIDVQCIQWLAFLLSKCKNNF